MTSVPYFPPDQLPDDLQPLGEDPFYAILGHRSDILRAWHELDVVFFDSTSKVSNRIKEEARRTLAQGIGCRFCASLGTPADTHPEPKEALAVAFAELVANDHRQINGDTFDLLREEFTEEEIVELVSWICFKLGSNMFGALMALAPATPEQVQGYADFVGEPA